MLNGEIEKKINKEKEKKIIWVNPSWLEKSTIRVIRLG
jgi:hypothetical protein